MYLCVYLWVCRVPEEQQQQCERNSVMIPVCWLCTTCTHTTVCRPGVSVCRSLMASSADGSTWGFPQSERKGGGGGGRGESRCCGKEGVKFRGVWSIEDERDAERWSGGAGKILMGALEDLLSLHVPRVLREGRVHLTRSKDAFVRAPRDEWVYRKCKWSLMLASLHSAWVAVWCCHRYEHLSRGLKAAQGAKVMLGVDPLPFEMHNFAVSGHLWEIRRSRRIKHRWKQPSS